MTSNAFDVQIPATEIQIAEAIHISDPETADTIRRLAFERDRLKDEIDPPVCRLQFPDGTVPGNAREAAEGWKRRYDKATKTICCVWAALGIDTYEKAEGMSIVEHVADLKRRAEHWERLHDHARDQYHEVVWERLGRATVPDEVAEHVRLTPRKPTAQCDECGEPFNLYSAGETLCRKCRADKQSMTDLAASGGIVDAP